MTEKSRIEAFSDGVFAIAMTLLVLDLKVPEDAEGHLAHILRDQWPAYAAFVVSFVLIGIIWVNHHAVFRGIARVDRPLLFLNLLLMMTVVVIPFPTALVADYVRAGGSDASIAAVVYSGVMLSMAVSFMFLWSWTVRAKLLGFMPTPEQVGFTLKRFGVGIFVYSAAIGLSFFNARLTLGLHVLVAAFYVFDQLYGQPAMGMPAIEAEIEDRSNPTLT